MKFEALSDELFGIRKDFQACELSPVLQQPRSPVSSAMKTNESPKEQNQPDEAIEQASSASIVRS